MSYRVELKKIEKTAYRYVIDGVPTCAALVQQTTGAPQTKKWNRGIRIRDAKVGSIKEGTAIATFDDWNCYSSSTNGRHAAIYVKHDLAGIKVIDQWEAKPTPGERTIFYRNEAVVGWQNNGDYFYVIE